MAPVPPGTMLFSKSKAPRSSSLSSDFAYVDPDACYLDAACQTLRPEVVIRTEDDYYRKTNACGGRVKYKWGKTVDERVGKSRAAVLDYAGKKEKEYVVAFTLNTTYGINLVLHQLPSGTFDRIVTSEIEHNSVFLPSMTWAKARNVPRSVLPRDEHGNLQYQKSDLQKAVVLMNSMSNIDGRLLRNAKQLADDTHAAGGILLLDGAQGFGHAVELLRETDYDAAFGSGHKMYGPSIGFIIIKRSLLSQLSPLFIGGGTVTDVDRDTFTLLHQGEEAFAALEPGLQNWSGILGLGAAVEWLKDQPTDAEHALGEQLFNGLSAMDRVHLINTEPSSVVSFHVDNLDAHRLAMFLDERQIMCRSGSFCCHSYLIHQCQLPPLLRVSVGLYNTPEHVAKFLDSLKTILQTF